MENAGLNRAYRLVWSEVHQAFVAVSELASSRGKRSGKAAVVLAAASLVGLAGMGSSAALAQSLPTGGQVVAGSGAISQSGQTLTITQTSDKMAANWQSFSIGQGHTVNFVQPSASAVALNRVLGADVSVIQGALNANGQVFLVNPNGVLFTPTAQVNVGALAASTLNLSTDDFLAGNYRFSGDSAALIKNEGSITTANGGTVALIAARIENTGSITALQGNVLLGAGSKVRLDLGGPVKIEVEEGALNTLIEQGGAIRAHGGLVYLTAKAAGDLASSVINHTGITEARSLSTGEKGEIWLMGDMPQGTVQVGGLLDASAAEGGQGGFIETSAHNVKVVDGAQVKAGHWLIDPVDFTIGAGGDISGNTLSTALGSTSVNIQTITGTNTATEYYGATGTNGDIFVNEAVSWNSPNQLTLSAHRDININADITAQHAGGKVQLRYGQGAVAASNTASYRFGGGKINLQAGDNFATKLGNDGAVTPWKVITELGAATDNGAASNFTLQGLAHSSNLGGKYVLGADIGAIATSGWNSAAGFMPIGDDTTKFTGSFDGLGHTITGLVIDRQTTDYVGLIGYTQNVTIRNVGMVGGSVKGQSYVGALVGKLTAETGTASIGDSSSTGSVTAANEYAGGLVGFMGSLAGGTTSITGSHATGEVDVGSYAGGLVGYVESDDGIAASISSSYATGNVKGGSRSGGLVGGGGNFTVSNSYAATGSVTGTSQVGGLIGALGAYDNAAQVSNSYATGKVQGDDNVGGLVGFSELYGSGTVSIVSSQAKGDVTGNSGSSNVGGLIGGLNADAGTTINISGSTAEGKVTGKSNVGGLIGFGVAEGGGAISISNDSQATGNVTGTFYTGGLAGRLDTKDATSTVSIIKSFSTGTVTGIGTNSEDVGGLVGRLNNPGITNGTVLIEESYATGAVTGANGGGLIGNAQNNGGTTTINKSYATGNLESPYQGGGLVGVFRATSSGTSSISNSYATGGVTGTPTNCTGNSGGLVGSLSADSSGTVSIATSYATGNVDMTTSSSSDGKSVGGLVGSLFVASPSVGTASISDSYATGNATGKVKVGGLVGSLANGTISKSYATGSVSSITSATSIGGLVGEAPSGGSISDSVWDIQTTGMSAAVGTGTVITQTNTSGKTTIEMQLPGTYATWASPAIWTLGKGEEVAGYGVLLPYLTNVTRTQDISPLPGTLFDGGWGGAINTSPGANGSAYGISSWGQLANINAVANAGYSFALKQDLDNLSPGYDTYAASTANGNAGWLPIGNSTKPFTGSFDGQSKTISALNINRPAELYVGLFGVAQNTAISNVALVGVNVTGSTVGQMAGKLLNSTIDNIYAKGNVTTNYQAGGLVGYMEDSFISNSYAQANVEGTWGVGGLVGSMTKGSISNSSAKGSVTGGDIAGGLVGYASEVAISGSHSESKVDGEQQIGGLTGSMSQGTVSNSSASGKVTGSNHSVGGLVGKQWIGTVSNSYATGDVKGKNSVGGLVGSVSAAGIVSNSYAVGAVTGTDAIVGGLVGALGESTVSNSYATGAVSGVFSGGLVGGSYNNSTITNSYATGAVTGVDSGGLVGVYDSGVFSSSFWDTQSTGKDAAQGIGSALGTPPVLTNVSGKTTAEMQTLATFTGAAWNIDDVGGTAKVWRIYEGDTYPLLRNFLTPLTVTAVNDLATTSRPYDGSTHSGGNGYTVAVIDPVADASKIFYGGTAQGAKNAGSYTLGIYSNQSGYDLSGGRFSSNGLTITPSALTAIIGSLTGSVNKTYDGTNAATLAAGNYLLSGWASGEGATVTQTSGTYDNANAGSAKTVSVSLATSDYSATGSTNLGNYSLPTTISGNIGKINPAALSVTGQTAANKTYDGSNSATLSGGSLMGVIGSDAVVLGNGTGTFATKNAGAGKAVTVTGTTLSGSAAGNYSVGNPTGITAAITAKNLTASYTASDKTYDGTTSASVSGTSSDLITTDAVTFSQTAAFADKNAGSGKTVTIGSISLAGTDAGNYVLQNTTATASADITAKALTVTANNASKTYDGIAYTGGNGVTYSSFVNSETSADLGGALNYTGNSQGATNAGSYAITPGGLTSSNYALGFVNGLLTIGTVVVTPSTSNITGALTGSVAKTYDGTNAATLTSDNYLLTGWIGSDGATVTKTSGTYDSASAGSAKQVTVSLQSTDYSATGTTNLGNYTLPTSISGNVGSIAKAPLTVTADNASKTYDGAAYAGGNGVTYSGFVHSETASVLGGALGFSGTSQGAKNAGSYAITPAGLTSGNYALSFTNGALTIDPRQITVTADAKSKVAGSADPALTYTVAADGVGSSRGLVGGENLAGALTRMAGEAVGGYAIKQGTVTDSNNPNYQIAYAGADLTISAAPVVVPPVVEPPVVVPPVVEPPVVVPPVVEPPVVVPPVVEPPVVVPPVVEPPVVVPPVVEPPVVVPPVVEPPVVVPPVVEPPVVVPPVVEPPVVVPPVVQPPVVIPPVFEPPVVVPPVVEPPSAYPLLQQQTAITLVVQAASRAASQDQDASEEPTIQGGFALVDAPDGPLLREDPERLAPSGLLNIVVVRGGINMGGGNARAPQR